MSSVQGPPLFPFAGVILALMLGITLVKLVIDQTNDLGIVQAFYKGMHQNTPVWFIGLNLSILGLGALSNLGMLLSSIRKPMPAKQRAVQLLLVIGFVANVAFAITTAGPAEKKLIGDDASLADVAHLAHLHKISVTFSIALIVGWGILKRITFISDVKDKTN